MKSSPEFNHRRALLVASAFVTLLVAVAYKGRVRDAEPSGAQPREFLPVAGPPSALRDDVPSASDVSRQSASPDRNSQDQSGTLHEAIERAVAASSARENFGSAWDAETRPAFAAFKQWTEQYLTVEDAARKALLDNGVASARVRRSELKGLIRSDPALAIASAVPMTVRSQLPVEVLAELEDYVSGVGELAFIGVTPLPGQQVTTPYFRLASVNGKHYEAFAYGRRDVPQTKVDISILGIALDQLIAVSESPLRILEPGEIPARGKPLNALCPISGELTPVDPDAPLNTREATAIELAGEVRVLCSSAHVPSYESALILSEDAAGPYSGALILGSEDLGTSGVPGRPPVSWTHGPKRVLVIRMDFSDLPGTPVDVDTGQEVTDDFAVNLFNRINGIRDFFEQGSYGKTTLTIAPTVAGDSPDVTPVYRMPNPAEYYATNSARVLSGLQTDAYRAATNGGYNLADYDRICMVVSYHFGRIPGAVVGNGGYGTLQGKNTWTYGSFSFWVVAHEIGHNYGLMHANLWQVSDGDPISPFGTSIEYGDPFSRMGTGPGIQSHFSQWEKSLLQWLPDSSVQTIEWAGTYRVHRFDHQNANLSSYLALKIPRDSTRDLWIGFRQAITNNASLLNGAYILWCSNSILSRSQLLDMTTPNTNAYDAGLGIGATFNDTESEMTIQPLGKGGSSPNEYLDVRITFPARIQWSSNTYAFDEHNGAATLTLLRSANSNGIVTVDFSTMDGAATAPEDYTGTNGTVTWPSGDITPKSISIPLVRDFLGENIEDFSVVLSGATGGRIVRGPVATVNIAAEPALVSHTLIKDINLRFDSAGSAPPASSRAMAAVGGMVFFIAIDELYGIALWRSDGTPEGTAVVRPGSAFDLTAGDGVLYFTASDPVYGTELWKTDGVTAAMVRDIGPGSSAPANLVNVNGTVFFTANVAPYGAELWKSDGTEAGTVIVKDIHPSDFVYLGSNPAHLVNVNGTLFFSANDGTSGIELWKSDGTEEGTTLVKDIRAGPINSTPMRLVNVDGALFFVADDGINGVELWTSDGTAPGTFLVTNIGPGSASSGPANFVNAGGTLFFTADDGVNGIELWTSDGTMGGTRLVKDIRGGSAASSPVNLVSVNGSVFFTANDGTNGVELWMSNGTADGTIMVRDIVAGSGSSNPTNLTEVNGVLFFSATDSNGTELWKSDGTGPGTAMVKDIYPLSSSSPADLINAAGTLFFRANNGINGVEFWKSDGTEVGTLMVKDIQGGTVASSPASLTDVNGTLFFTAHNGTNGVELWTSDGTEAGTALVRDIRAGISASGSTNLVNIGGTLFFGANSGSTGVELWKSDGTSNGTVLVKDIRGGTLGSSPANLTDLDGTLFFSANNGPNGVELWKSDGTSDGTTMVRDIRSGSGSSSPDSFLAMNGTLFFGANNGLAGRELWKSDGTSNGTVMVTDIRPGSGSSLGSEIVAANGVLFFSAWDGGTNGYELWKSDATSNGTVMVKDIYPGIDSSAPSRLTTANERLFFTANVGGQGGLWTSDGTAEGTVLLRSVVPNNLTPAYGRLFFTATDGTNGLELWTSDGTESGTRMVDIYPGSGSGRPDDLTAFNGRLFFTADDGVHGRRLWTSDGTAAGTFRLADFPGDPLHTAPENLTVVGRTLFFTATYADIGMELAALFLYDFGDAPDPVAAVPGYYPTRAANDGARHLIPPRGPALYLGTLGPNGDLDAQPNVSASRDAAEDGVSLPPFLDSGETFVASVMVTGSNGLLNGWIDWNRDGDWDDTGEQVVADQMVTSVTNYIGITVPNLSAGGASFARFRLSTVAGLAPAGAASDGEVEDYQVTLRAESLATILQIATIGDGAFVLTLNGIPNRTYRIEYADRLRLGATSFWQTVGTVQSDSQGRGVFTNSPATQSGFYRTALP